MEGSVSKTLTLAVWGRSRCRGRPQPRRRCWEPASGTPRGFPSVGSAWLAGATRVYTHSSATSKRHKRRNSGRLGTTTSSNARTRRGAVTCTGRPGPCSLRVRQRVRTATAGKVYKAPEERARRRARAALASRAGLGNAGKGLSPKRGAQGAGKSPPRPRGGADTALDVSPRPPAADEPRCPQAGRDPTVPRVPHAGRRARPLRTPRLRPRPREDAAPATLPCPPGSPSPRSGAGGRSPRSGRLAGRAGLTLRMRCRDGAGRARRRGRRRRGGERPLGQRGGPRCPRPHTPAPPLAAGEPAARGGAGRRLPGGWAPGRPLRCLAPGPSALGAFVPGRGGPTFLAPLLPSPSRSRAPSGGSRSSRPPQRWETAGVER